MSKRIFIQRLPSVPGVANVVAAGAGGYAGGTLLNKASDLQMKYDIPVTGSLPVDMLTYQKKAAHKVIEHVADRNRVIVKREGKVTVRSGEWKRRVERTVGHVWGALNNLIFSEEEQRQKWEKEEQESGNAAPGVRG